MIDLSISAAESPSEAGRGADLIRRVASLFPSSLDEPTAASSPPVAWVRKLCNWTLATTSRSPARQNIRTLRAQIRCF